MVGGGTVGDSVVGGAGAGAGSGADGIGVSSRIGSGKSGAWSMLSHHPAVNATTATAAITTIAVIRDTACHCARISFRPDETQMRSLPSAAGGSPACAR